MSSTLAGFVNSWKSAAVCIAIGVALLLGLPSFIDDFTLIQVTIYLVMSLLAVSLAVSPARMGWVIVCAPICMPASRMALISCEVIIKLSKTDHLDARARHWPFTPAPPPHLLPLVARESIRIPLPHDDRPVPLSGPCPQCPPAGPLKIASLP